MVKSEKKNPSELSRLEEKKNPECRLIYQKLNREMVEQ